MYIDPSEGRGTYRGAEIALRVDALTPRQRAQAASYLRAAVFLAEVQRARAFPSVWEAIEHIEGRLRVLTADYASPEYVQQHIDVLHEVARGLEHAQTAHLN